MKLRVEDIKIIARNKQVKQKIIEKFGSLDSFANTIGMAPKSVKQYLKQSAEYNDHFRGHLCIHIGDYYSLWKTDKQQLEEYVDILVRDIYSYNEEDLEVLDKVLQLSIEYDMTKLVAKCYRNIGRCHLNMKAYTAGLGYYSLAKYYAEKVKDIDTMCMVVSEMMTAYTFMIEYRKGDRLSREFEENYSVEKVSPNIRFWYYYSVSVLFVHDKSYPYAKAYLDRAKGCAESDYQRQKVYNLLGVYYKKNRDYLNATKYYNEALVFSESGRDKGICYNNLASLYHAMGDRKLAEDNINHAMEYIDTDDNYNCILIYGTYADICKTEESIFKLLEIVQSKSDGAFIPLILEGLNVAIDNISDTDKVKDKIIKMIKKNENNIKFKHELYLLYAAVACRSEVN